MASADQQRVRIHPVDLESGGHRPTEPLVPPTAPRSDKVAYPAAPDGDRYFPAPRRSSIPRPPKTRRSCCCRCLCCTFLTVFVLLILVAATLGILYLVFDPKLPKYTVNSLAVSTFAVDSSLNARATFAVTATAVNPNKKIGIYYDDGSKLSVSYAGYALAAGAWPAFYQGHENTTVLSISMSGQVELGSSVMAGLQQAEAAGAVPLQFDGDVPVRVKLGALRLWQVTSTVRCALVVDSLTAGGQIKVKTSDCSFGLKL